MPKKSSRRKNRGPMGLLVVGVVILLAALVLAFKPDKASQVVDSASASDSPTTQLDRALQAGQPTLAFFHSDTCQQCLIMMETVSQVYPEFASSVALVDINVYDKSNQALLYRVRLQYIPTLIFYDRTGREQVSVGVMEAEQLSQALAALAEGD